MIKFKIHLFLLGTFLFLFSCSQEKINLKNDPTVLTVFSTQEAEELQEILTFFTDQICLSEGVENTNSSDCFYQFMERIHRDAPANGTIQMEIDYEKQKELYSYPVSDHIWIPAIGENSYSDSIHFQGIAITGKYLDFVKEVGQEIPTIASYHKNTLHSGHPDPSFIMKLSPEELDSKDARIQLIVAVHFLTINEDFNQFDIPFYSEGI